MAKRCDELTVVESGPRRGIGLGMRVEGDQPDFAGLWQKQVFPRAAEIVRPPQAAALGVCRCIPGSFEYLALLEATADAPVPAGMIAVQLPRAHYAVFEVNGLAALGTAWRRIPDAVAAQTTWQPYCGPQGCECATHPSFEYHAWDSDRTGKILIYVPVRRP